MNREEFITKLFPVIGTETNVSLCEFQQDDLYITVKDSSFVNRDEIEKLPYVEKVDFYRNRLMIHVDLPKQIIIEQKALETKEEPKMAINNEQIAKEVLDAVGGKENVTSAVHCMTRLRLTLVDDSIPNDETVKEINGVLGVARAGGQYQVIIGQNVPKVYEEVCKIGNFKKEEMINENLDGPKEKLTPKKIGSNIMNYLSGSVTPLIPLMMGAAMFKTIAAIFGSGMLGWIADGSSLAILLDFVYNAGFYFFPIYLGYSAAKKLNTSIPLGMLFGGILIAPGFMSLIGSEVPFDVYGIPCVVNNYSNSVIPIILTVWAMSYVYKFFEKYVPSVLSTVFTPFLTIVVMLPISLCAFAPLGIAIGNYLAVFLNWFAQIGGGIAVAFIAATYCFLVMTGMHSPLAVMAITTLFATGSDSLFLLGSTCAMSACCGMTLGAFLRLKNPDEKSLSLGYLAALLASGITEPALYGIGLRYKKPFVALAIGGLCGGLYAGFTHVTYHALIAPIVMYPFAFGAGGATNMMNGTIACVISFVVATVVCTMFCFDKKAGK